MTRAKPAQWHNHEGLGEKWVLCSVKMASPYFMASIQRVFVDYGQKPGFRPGKVVLVDFDQNSGFWSILIGKCGYGRFWVILGHWGFPNEFFELESEIRGLSRFLD